jgi:hypothetical protein
MKTLVHCLLACALVASLAAAAQESRQINRIATPQSNLRLPAGARSVAAIRPVATVSVEAAVRELAEAWNTPRLPQYLAPNFYGKERLADSLNTQFPRDARLRVLGIQSTQTVAQFLQDDPGGGELRVSRVSVVVRTQVEFNDPRGGGLRRIEGTNEFLLRVAEPGP